MIPTILMLCAFLPLGSVVLDLNRDTRRQWAEETDGDNWHGADVHELPAARSDLTGDWPQPLTPLGLPSLSDPSAKDWLRAEEAPIIVELHAAGGRHRVGEAPGTDTQRQRWNSPTGQFWAIVEFNTALDEPCSHCAAPEDGEPAHAGCPGCCCPCGLIPDGVEGHAIAGGTR